jgi:hypothetical protein
MNLSPLPIQKFFDNNGQPLAGGLLFTYATGTSNKVTSYVDSTGLVPNTNPIVLDSRGECRLWIDDQQAYRYVLAPANDTDPPTNPIWTVDNISAAPRPNLDIRNFGAVGNGITDDTAAIQAALNNAAATGDAVIIPRGVYRVSGTLTTGALGNRKTSIFGMGGVLKQFGSVANILEIRSAGCEIVGLEFQTDASVTASNGVSAIDVLGVSDVSIDNCVFTELRIRGIGIRSDATGDTTDVTISGCHFVRGLATAVVVHTEDDDTFVRRITIVGNTFESPDQAPVSEQTRAIHLISNCSDVAISGNICSGTAAVDYSLGWRDCFMVGNSSATLQPERVTIAGNRITGMADDGVGISGAKHVAITGNVIHSSPVTSGIYVPSDGTWANEDVVVSANVIYDCHLAGIFLKSTRSYAISGNLIKDCEDGIFVNSNGAGILRGTISANTIHNVRRRGIYWDGGACSCTNNIIDGFGDAGAVAQADKAAIFLNDSTAGSVVTGNVMMNGINGFVITGNGSEFIVSNNVVRSSCSGVGVMFIAFTGTNFMISNNILAAAAGAFSNAPAVTSVVDLGNNLPQFATLTLTQGVATLSTITPPQITADQNNYSPTGWIGAYVVRLSSDAARNITGLGRNGTSLIKIVQNIGTQNIVLVHESASSAANQRLRCPGGANFTLGAGSGAHMIYDGSSDRWRVVAMP